MMHQNPKLKGGGNQDKHDDMSREEGNTSREKRNGRVATKRNPLT
jgi:hypothetical protein